MDDMAKQDQILNAFSAFDVLSVPDDDHELVGIVLMPPRDFLKLAAPIAARIDSAGRINEIERCLDGGVPFETLPELRLSIQDEDAFIEMHDGRHRALCLRDRGVSLMPILLFDEERMPGDPSFDWSEISHLYPQGGDDDEEYVEADLEGRDVPMALGEETSWVFLATEDVLAVLREQPAPGPM